MTSALDSLTLSWLATPDHGFNSTFTVFLDNTLQTVSLNEAAASSEPIDFSVLAMDGNLVISGLTSGTAYVVEFRDSSDGAVYTGTHYTRK